MEPNAAAVERMIRVKPMLAALEPAEVAIGLPDRTILHAGPPLLDPTSPPAPILNAAVIACLYEGWADDEAVAERLIRSGRVHLAPAQDRGAVTPLAAVISPSMPMQVIEDEAGVGPTIVSPLSSGAGPQLRFGSRDPEIVERLRWRETVLAEVLRGALDTPIPLMPIAVQALPAGDDLHARTTTATATLRAILAERIGEAPGFGEVQAHIERSPLMFLTVWMAACRCILGAADGVPHSTVVTGMAGNGQEFGIRLAGRPRAWVTAPAESPSGPRLHPELNAQVSGALGDSAVIDALGFGGQALSFSADTLMMLGNYVPRGLAEIPEALLIATHPAFDAPPLRVALDAMRVVETGIAPIVALAMIDATGQAGLVGRGVYRPPVDLFARACTLLAAAG